MPPVFFRTEGPIHYERYQFGYCEWLELSSGEDPAPAYAAGFLPFSGRPADPRLLFYMARSLRVDLERFRITKKRRYDHRRWEHRQLRREVLSKEVFLSRHGSHAYEWARDWMQTRFGKPYMDRTRFDFILRRPFLQHVITWYADERVVAFAPVVLGSDWAHYWYVFYENDPAGSHAPGHGYLLDFIRWAQSENLHYAYLGTAYGRKSRYKSRGIRGIEFWDGNAWCSSSTALHQRQEQETTHRPE